MISQVNGNSNTSGSATSITIGYVPTAGNVICVFVNTASSTSACTCSDNHSAALTAGPTINIGAGPTIYSFYYFVPVSLTLSFTAKWTGSSPVSITVEEYQVSGGSIVINGSLSGNTNSGTSTAPSITVTTQDNNDWVVVGFGNGGSRTVSATTGNLRQQVTSGMARSSLLDNTVVSAGSVTVTGSMTGSTAWAAALIELRFFPSLANSLMLLGVGT